MSEKNIQSLIMLALSKVGVIAFRQNTGMGWAGQAQKITHEKIVTLHPGDVVIRGARPLHAGLCKGSSDLIGMKMVRITPSMVGHKLAVFVAVEVKAERGTLRTEQETFIRAVQKAGGIAGMARSEAEAIKLVTEWPIKEVDSSSEMII